MNHCSQCAAGGRLAHSCAHFPNPSTTLQAAAEAGAPATRHKRPRFQAEGDFGRSKRTCRHPAAAIPTVTMWRARVVIRFACLNQWWREALQVERGRKPTREPFSIDASAEHTHTKHIQTATLQVPEGDVLAGDTPLVQPFAPLPLAGNENVQQVSCGCVKRWPSKEIPPAFSRRIELSMHHFLCAAVLMSDPQSFAHTPGLQANDAAHSHGGSASTSRACSAAGRAPSCGPDRAPSLKTTAELEQLYSCSTCAAVRWWYPRRYACWGRGGVT